MPRASRRDVLRLLGAGAVGSKFSLPAGLRRDLHGPGATSYWTTGQQFGVGTVQDHGSTTPSRVWFTLTEGALAGARFPRVDLMNLRTLDFVVAHPDTGYVARTDDESRRDDATSSVERHTELADDRALVYEQTISDAGEHRWTLTVEYVTHPYADAILLDATFTAHDGRRYDVSAVVDPALSNSGMGDSATIRRQGSGAQRPVLVAHDGTGNDADATILDRNGDPYNVAMAVRSRTGFERATVDYAGGDAIQGLLNDGTLGGGQTSVTDGDVVLVGQVGSGVNAVHDTLALGFAEGADTAAAAAVAKQALDREFAAVRKEYAGTWRAYLAGVDVPQSVRDEPALENQYLAAAMVLKAVEDKTFLGAGIASPSVPWGEAVQADKPADFGYNYVWARDLYQVFTAFQAMGDHRSAANALEYLYAHQQRDDCFIPQTTFVDGRVRWPGQQMDEVSVPQIMAYQLATWGGYTFAEAGYDYENVKRSADYVVANGPVTGQERWEEESGYSPSTIAAEVAGLACAARLAADEGHSGDALVYVAFADRWQASVEEWCATTEGTSEHGETPYYFRIDDNRNPDDGDPRSLANGGPTLDERNVVDAGFLELVRLGVKPWNDPAITNSVDVVDSTIRVETPNGPGFYRYNGDTYGEQPDGAPWEFGGDTTGVGRLWPILTGERGEYELFTGTTYGANAPKNLLRTMQRFANSGRMIPEQVWDRPESTAYDWTFGEGTGSATPLAWSMAQFVRLAHSIDAGQPVERPAFVADRYTGRPLPPGPSLSVTFPDSLIRKARATISGTTDGEVVVVKTLAETKQATVDSDGSFEVSVSVLGWKMQFTVVAATCDELEYAGTTVEQKTVS